MKKWLSYKSVIIKWGLLFTLVIVYLVFLSVQSQYYLNSDETAQMILGAELVKERRVISYNWFYANELYLLNCQLVFETLLFFIKDWHLVRVLGSLILYVILFATLAFLLSGVGVDIKKKFPLAAIPFLVPISFQYRENCLVGLFYIPYISISFGTVGVFLYCIKNDRSIIKKIVFISSAACVAYLAGVASLRQLFVCYIPLFVAYSLILIFHKISLEKKDSSNKYDWKPFVFWGGLCVASTMVASILGYMTYVLHYKREIEINSFGGISFVAPDLNRFMELINGILDIFGYKSNVPLFSGQIVVNGFAVVLTCMFLSLVVIFFKRLLSEPLNLSFQQYYGFSMLVMFFGLYWFTDLIFFPRYLIPVIAFFVPIIAECGVIQKNTMYATIRNVLVICMCGIALIRYDSLFTHDYNRGQIELSEYLVQNDYYNGYATYWNANNITEYSSGRIDIRVWEIGGDIDISDVDQVVSYNQLKSHGNTIPDGRVFLLFAGDEVDRYSLAANLDDDSIIYKEGIYTVYGYENYDEMCKDIYG